MLDTYTLLAQSAAAQEIQAILSQPKTYANRAQELFAYGTNLANTLDELKPPPSADVSETELNQARMLVHNRRRSRRNRWPNGPETRRPPSARRS